MTARVAEKPESGSPCHPSPASDDRRR
jgi:hypothetical protein